MNINFVKKKTGNLTDESLDKFPRKVTSSGKEAEKEKLQDGLKITQVSKDNGRQEYLVTTEFSVG